MKQNIMITGASGFLGFNLCKDLASEYEIWGTYYKNVPQFPLRHRIQLDVTSDLVKMEDIFKSNKFRMIIHAAAIAQADECEEYPEETREVNVIGSERMAWLAKKYGIPMIFISTDLVYSGDQGPHRESEAAPNMVYSISKYEAEKLVRHIHPNSTVLRCALMYGPDDGHRRSFIRQMHEKIQMEIPLKLFTDQYRTPLWVEDVGQAIRLLLKNHVTGQTFNLGGPDRLTRFEMGMMAADLFEWNKDLIHPVKMVELDHLAGRPNDCSLNSDKIIQALHWKNTPFLDGLKKLKRIVTKVG